MERLKAFRIIYKIVSKRVSKRRRIYDFFRKMAQKSLNGEKDLCNKVKNEFGFDMRASARRFMAKRMFEISHFITQIFFSV